jgi:hypothetical protein
MATQPRKGFVSVPPAKSQPPRRDEEPVTVPELPTLEQLENTAVAMGFRSILMVRHLPHYEESLRNLHALVVRTLNGDDEAASRLAMLKAAFGRNV